MCLCAIALVPEKSIYMAWGTCQIESCACCAFSLLVPFASRWHVPGYPELVATCGVPFAAPSSCSPLKRQRLGVHRGPQPHFVLSLVFSFRELFLSTAFPAGSFQPSGRMTLHIEWCAIIAMRHAFVHSSASIRFEIRFVLQMFIPKTSKTRKFQHLLLHENHFSIFFHSIRFFRKIPQPKAPKAPSPSQIPWLLECLKKGCDSSTYTEAVPGLCS